MDVTALAAGLLAARNEVTIQDVQVNVLKRGLQSQSVLMTRLMAPMALPLATEGRLGTNLNHYL
ncbi:MAG TPA: putative motility protein [Dermatophilaceae bacterium]|nr:putative motility protein [Dermatophilaceae bacterium]